MITFAPGQEPSVVRESLQYNSSVVQTLRPMTRKERLPFEFMHMNDVNDTTAKDEPVKHNPILLVLFNFMRDLVKQLFVIIRAWSLEESQSGTSTSSKILSSECQVALMHCTQTKTQTKTPKPILHRSKQRNQQRKVENPKDLVYVTPSALFDLQPGEWMCSSCGYKNPVETLSCDACLAIKANGRIEVKSKPENSPSAMSCDSSACEDEETNEGCNSCSEIDAEGFEADEQNRQQDDDVMDISRNKDTAVEAVPT
jgi:hypothetical protein